MRLGIEARSSQTAHGSVLGSAPMVSVQLTPNRLTPAFPHATCTNTGNPRPRSALLALGLLVGRRLRLLLLIEQEGFGSQVGLGSIGLELGGFDCRPALQQICCRRIDEAGAALVRQ